jgi:nicotinamide mononucleotide transporter
VNELTDVFLNQLHQAAFLEAIAVFFGLVSVWLAKKEHILVYPTGIVSVIIYIWITHQYQLYGDMGVNTYYLVMSIYGWYFWTRTVDNQFQVPITKNNHKENLITCTLAVTSFLIIRFALNFTDSVVPTWDALTTATAVTGMWLMARKKLENWIAWIITDLISIPLYLYKGLPLTGCQFLIFTILATWGYFTWKKQLELRESQS